MLEKTHFFYCGLVFVLLFCTFSKAYDEEEGFGFLGWKYGELAFEKCKSHPKIDPKNAIYRGVCGNFEEAIESSFDTVGQDMKESFSEVIESNEEITKRAFEDSYWKNKGIQMLNGMIDYIAKNPRDAKDPEELKKHLSTKFFEWFSKVLANKRPPQLPEKVRKMFKNEDLDRIY